MTETDTSSDSSIDTTNFSVVTNTENPEPADMEDEPSNAVPDEDEPEGDDEQEEGNQDESPETEVEDDDIDGEEEAEKAEVSKASEEDAPAEGEDTDASEYSGFEFTCEAGNIRKLFSATKPVTDEAVLVTDNDSVMFETVDTAVVAMANPVLNSSVFESFHAGEHTFGINVQRMNDVLGQFDTDEVISGHITADHQLEITDGKLTFSISLLDIDTIQDSPELPEFEHDVKLTIETSKLETAMKGVDMVSKHITIRAKDETLFIEGEGDTDDVNLSLTPDDDEMLSPPMGDGKVILSLDYLNDIMSGYSDGKISPEEITFGFSDEMPIIISGEYEDNAGSCRYMLAPRIDSQ